MKKIIVPVLLMFFTSLCQAQIDTLRSKHSDSVNLIRLDTVPPVLIDTTLRIINLNPFFSVHVDSTLTYQFQINKNTSNYFWYLKNAPVGLRINKDNGLLIFRADKSYFLSG